MNNKSELLGPEPNTVYPINGYDKLVFLKNIVKASNIFVGDYTYFDDPKNGPENFETNNVLYNYHESRVKLVFGKFCAIATETKFIMTGDHKLDSISTYPFPIFSNSWEQAYDINKIPIKGDIIVGNDVWFGYGSTVKNGVSIGNGAIIATNAVVVKDVPAYSIVAGNPARVVKMRFNNEQIDILEEVQWWNWDIEKISKNLAVISNMDIAKLQSLSKNVV